MRVLYLLSQHPGNTGSGVYLKWITKQAIKNNLDIKVLIGINKGFDYRKELPHIEEENIYPVTFPFLIPGMSDVMPYKSSKFKELSPEQLKIYKNNFTEKLKLIKKQFSPDIIHSNHLWILSSLARRIFPDTPLIVSCHGTELRQKEFCPYISNDIENNLKKLDLIIALTEHQKQEIVNWLNINENKIVVLGGAYPDDIFYCKIKNFTENVYNICYAGKISYAKGVPYLILAFEKLKRYNNLHINLLLAGGYESEEGMKIKSSVKNKNIKFLGNLNQVELAELFRNSNLFILPSFFEGLPLVVLEALACGCEVIVTEHQNIKNWFDEDFLKLNCLKFIPLPKLKNVDEINEKEINKFVENIKEQLEKSIENFINGYYPDIEKITKYIKQHSYSNLFSRLLEIYKFLAKRKMIC